MRGRGKYIKAVLVVLFSLVLAFGGVFLIGRHKQKDKDRWNFGDMEEYLTARSQLDNRITELEKEILDLELSLKGTVVLMFDQCTANAYDIIYPQLTEFEMTGSLVFCDKAPGDEGAITVEQWREMRQNGWSSVLATAQGLSNDTPGSGAYTEALLRYAEDQRNKFTALGLEAPTAYAFSEGECTEDAMKALGELGFTVFTAPDAETKLLGESGVLFGQTYLASGPNAPLIQGQVDLMKNKAHGLVIKTRYVHEIQDLDLDTELGKFRAGMLTTLSGYCNAGSIQVGSLEKGNEAYRGQCDAQKEFQLQEVALQLEIRAIEEQLAKLWQQYRS